MEILALPKAERRGHRVTHMEEDENIHTAAEDADTTTFDQDGRYIFFI